jgi:hypothetical protein
MGGYPSGQRGQTVNLLAQPSQVRILLRPPVPPAGAARIWGCHHLGLPSLGLPSLGLPSLGLPSLGLPSLGLPSLGLPSLGLPSLGLSTRCVLARPHSHGTLRPVEVVEACRFDRLAGPRLAGCMRRTPRVGFVDERASSAPVPMGPKGGGAKDPGASPGGSEAVRRGSSSVVERQPSKLNVAGSTPVSRSTAPLDCSARLLRSTALPGNRLVPHRSEAQSRRPNPRRAGRAHPSPAALGSQRNRSGANRSASCCSSVVEHFLGKEEVTGSSPVSSSNAHRGARRRRPRRDPISKRTRHSRTIESRPCGRRSIDLPTGYREIHGHPAVHRAPRGCPSHHTT